jgi:hypothetical protein
MFTPPKKPKEKESLESEAKELKEVIKIEIAKEKRTLSKPHKYIN